VTADIRPECAAFSSALIERRYSSAGCHVLLRSEIFADERAALAGGS